MTDYSKYVATRQRGGETPQSQPIPGKPMVKNSAGGYSFTVDQWTQLDRFLVLGAEGGTYYASEQNLTEANVKSVLACIASDGVRVVNRIVEISEAGRAPKNDPAIFALALCASKGDEATRKAAFAAVQKVCRIPTHLFHFNRDLDAFRGWGRARKNAILSWYETKPESELAYHAVKYQQRDGWSHRDLLRLTRPKPVAGTSRATIYHWMVKGWEDVGEQPHPDKNVQVIWAFERAKRAKTEAEVAKLVSDYKLPLEAVPTDKRGPEVWAALLPHQPITNLIRNLGNLSKCGLLRAGNYSVIQQVVSKLTNAELLAKGKVHPIQVLAALTTYGSGRGVRGSGEWQVVPDVLDALNKAFYLAFGAVEPANKRFTIGLDVSGSMGGGSVSGVPGLTPARAAAALLTVTHRTEPRCTVMAFADTFKEIPLTRSDTLETVMSKTSMMNFGGTDCALPMTWALENKVETDTFMVLTDSETWAGRIQPAQALQKYRDKMGIPAKLVVVGMTSGPFTIADPSDAGMLDVVGFDTATPNLISDFAADRF